MTGPAKVSTVLPHIPASTVSEPSSVRFDVSDRYFGEIPVAGLPYKLISDGKIHEGALDENGMTLRHFTADPNVKLLVGDGDWHKHLDYEDTELPDIGNLR